MEYWLDLFTVRTYDELQTAGARISSFRERRRAICEQVWVGDKLLMDDN
jgi:hypothetical protein